MKGIILDEIRWLGERNDQTHPHPHVHSLYPVYSRTKAARDKGSEGQERVRKENGVSGKEMSLTHPFPSCHSHHLFSFAHFVHGN